jgi:gluconokinase
VEVTRIVLMGVAGAGKTTIGRIVASRLAAPFVDADDLHAPDAIARMHTGVALDDADREPWLRRVGATVRDLGPGSLVLACSALKPSYRDVLRAAAPDLTFVLLDVDAHTVAERLVRRSGHFAGLDLLPSQLAILDPGGDTLRVHADGPPAAVADAVLAAVRRRSQR